MSLFGNLFFILFISAASVSAAETFKDELYNIQHEVNNHELEIQSLVDRLKIQESILDSINQDNKNSCNTKNLENKIGNLESTLGQVVIDIREFKQQNNNAAKVLAEYKQKILEQESQINKLQTALNSVVEALQIEVQGSLKNVYVVLPGDSLEKIARRHKLTIKQLKEMNNLKTDRIYIGQKLKLP